MTDWRLQGAGGCCKTLSLVSVQGGKRGRGAMSLGGEENDSRQPTVVNFGKSRGGLATLGMWDEQSIPSQHHMRAGPAPEEGETPKPVGFRGAKDEVNMPSRQLFRRRRNA